METHKLERKESWRITIKVQPRSSKEAVEQLADGTYKVFVHSPPTDGEANKAVIEILAKHFKTAKSNVKIVSGIASRNKIVDISFPYKPHN